MHFRMLTLVWESATRKISLEKLCPQNSNYLNFADRECQQQGLSLWVPFQNAATAVTNLYKGKYADDDGAVVPRFCHVLYGDLNTLRLNLPFSSTREHRGSSAELRPRHPPRLPAQEQGRDRVGEEAPENNQAGRSHQFPVWQSPASTDASSSAQSRCGVRESASSPRGRQLCGDGPAAFQRSHRTTR